VSSNPSRQFSVNFIIDLLQGGDAGELLHSAEKLSAESIFATDKGHSLFRQLLGRALQGDRGHEVATYQIVKRFARLFPSKLGDLKCISPTLDGFG
jgi:hypothetical protein